MECPPRSLRLKTGNGVLSRRECPCESGPGQPEPVQYDPGNTKQQKSASESGTRRNGFGRRESRARTASTAGPPSPRSLSCTPRRSKSRHLEQTRERRHHLACQHPRPPARRQSTFPRSPVEQAPPHLLASTLACTFTCSPWALSSGTTGPACSPSPLPSVRPARPPPSPTSSPLTLLLPSRTQTSAGPPSGPSSTASSSGTLSARLSVQAGSCASLELLNSPLAHKLTSSCDPARSSPPGAAIFVKIIVDFPILQIVNVVRPHFSSSTSRAGPDSRPSCRSTPSSRSRSNGRSRRSQGSSYTARWSSALRCTFGAPLQPVSLVSSNRARASTKASLTL